MFFLFLLSHHKVYISDYLFQKEIPWYLSLWYNFSHWQIILLALDGHEELSHLLDWIKALSQNKILNSHLNEIYGIYTSYHISDALREMFFFQSCILLASYLLLKVKTQILQHYGLRNKNFPQYNMDMYPSSVHEHDQNFSTMYWHLGLETQVYSF